MIPGDTPLLPTACEYTLHTTDYTGTSNTKNVLVTCFVESLEAIFYVEVCPFSERFCTYVCACNKQL